MLRIDVFTAYAVCGAGCLAGASMMLLARPTEPTTRSALNTFIGAFLSLAVGLFQYVFVQYPPRLMVFWGGYWVVLGTALACWGALQLRGKRMNPVILYIALPPLELVLVGASFFGDKAYAVALDGSCLVITSLLALVQPNYLLRPRNGSEFALGSTLVAFAAVSAIRGWASLTYVGPPVPHLLFLSEPWSSVLALSYCVMPVIIASLVLNVLNMQLNNKLHALALTDELTGLVTRRGLYELADETQAKARSQDRQIGLLLLDIDHFKRVNDTHGHHAGDKVIRHTAKLMQNSVRADSVVTRYGGEEFVVLLSAEDIEAAKTVAERMRSNIAASPCHHEDLTLRLTVSIGVSIWSPGEHLQAAIQRADEALYRAKGSGRDRVELGVAVPELT
jgi:diguanylate cyclase (GGDEF)-like protein